VLGAKAELRHAAALMDLATASASTAADVLTAAGLLERGRPLRLAHPVVRAVLYAELGQGRREQLHHRAARILADDAADLDVIAGHLLVTEPAGEPWTVEVLRRGAGRALGRGAATAAVAYLRRALAEPPPAEERAGVLHELGVAEMFVDPAASVHLGQALDLTHEPARRAEIAFDLSSAYVVSARVGDAIEVLEEVLAGPGAHDRELRWRAEAQLLSTAFINSAYTAVLERHVAQIPHDLRGETPGERLVLGQLAYASLMSGQPAEMMAELAKRALGDGQLIAEQPPTSVAVTAPIIALAYSEQHELALEAYDELLDGTRRAGAPAAFAYISALRSQLHSFSGAIPDALADARAAVDAAGNFAWTPAAPIAFANLIDALLEAGDVSGAEDALIASGLGEEIPEMIVFFFLLRSRARLRLAQGQTREGIGDILAAQAMLERSGITVPAGTHCRSIAAVALAGIDERSDTQRLVADELAASRRFGAPGTIGISLRAAGVVEGGSVGIEHLRAAVAHLERSTARLEHARALSDLGAALRRSGQRREAQRSLRQALDLADRCGGRAVAAQARAELLITGARPRRARVSGAEALTASERRVAQLAAQGLTNRQVAQALFISHPTVVTHLSHCYQKLGISSRDQLSNALGESPTRPSDARGRAQDVKVHRGAHDACPVDGGQDGAP
jgi:DNA-binding CsgD family transcriptional regulator